MCFKIIAFVCTNQETSHYLDHFYYYQGVLDIFTMSDFPVF